MERTGYPYGKKPWLRRDSCVHFQRTVVDDHRDLVFGVSVVLVGLVIVALVMLAHA